MFSNIIHCILVVLQGSANVKGSSSKNLCTFRRFVEVPLKSRVK